MDLEIWAVGFLRRYATSFDLKTPCNQSRFAPNRTRVRATNQ